VTVAYREESGRNMAEHVVVAKDPKKG